MSHPRLIITVDTEEEGLWSGQFRMTGNTVQNIGRIPRFQALCDQLKIRPTYLVDAPVVQDCRASDILAEIHADGRCEIGAHLHPWCNPPLDDVYDQRETYLCNLPADLQQAKIEWLTIAIMERFGQRPVSFRAGRYGLDITGARLLEQNGYRVDSSVIPFTNYSAGGGPDFTDAPWQPYYVGDDDLNHPETAGELLEVPVGVGFNRVNFSAAMTCQRIVARPAFRWLRLEGILDRLGIVRRIKLSPEQSDARAMKKLMDCYCAASKHPTMVMMFHSTSLSPGHSPYVRDERELDTFLRRIADTVEHAVQKHSAACCTLSELAIGREPGARAGSPAADSSKLPTGVAPQ
ncbi:MAG: polysaccharide deacetylase family protein [Planctomycetaceae bacterium]